MKHANLSSTIVSRRGARGSSPRVLRRWTSVLFGSFAALALAACNSSDSDSVPGGGTGTTPSGGTFFEDPNFGGNAQSMKIAALFWGRLADVYDRDPLTGESELQFPNFVIGDNIISDSVTFEVSNNPITGQERVTILREAGTPAFNAAITQLEANLQPILINGVDSSETPPFSGVPRNATVVVRFDDLLDPGTINSTSVQVRVGNPPTTSFEARIFADTNHGGLKGDTFYPTRIIIDMSVSQIEALGSSLPVNAIGLPQAPSTTQANVGLFFPTKLDAITTRLENLTDHPVAFANNGPVAANSALSEVVRGFRSGVSSDPFNGFLRDETPPSILGVQPVGLTNVTPGANPDEFFVDMTFQSPACAVDAEAGDVIQTSGNFAEVLSDQSLNLGALLDVNVRLLNGTTLSPGSADYLTVYNPVTDVSECFVRFNPPAQTPPNTDVSVNSRVVVRFSEPMDPNSVLPFGTFTVQAMDTTNLSAFEVLTVGSIEASPDRSEFRFSPRTAWRHQQGSAETYLVNLSAEVSDLAGNPVTATTGQTSFDIAPGEITQDTSGFVLAFESLDQDGDGFPEISGNFLVNLLDGFIIPRSVSRFNSVIDSAQPQVSPMQVFGAPIQTPLSNLGSKMQTVWRNIDMGLGLLDGSTWDLDVEGISWAPFNGQVQLDTFSEFEIRLAHGRRLPDEVLNPTSLLPVWPTSGLNTTYDNNILQSTNAPMKTVHAKSGGFSIQPLNAFTAATGRLLMPWPMNQNVSAGQFITYTWRDTGARERGGPSGAGANPQSFVNGTNIGAYAVDAVPTIGLPLLMEFRCFPDSDVFAQNGLQIALAVNSSARPNFRAFSTGGIDQQGIPQSIDPDNEPVARGGYNPAMNGAPTQGTDNSVHFGQADFVVKVSRVQSRWFDTGALSGATYAEPVIEPATQPSGTSLTMSYRGATDFSGNGNTANANLVGAYGDYGPSAQDYTNPNAGYTPLFLNGVNEWQNDISAIDGAQYVQFRVTFVSNIETLLTPSLSAVGIPFIR